MTGKKDDKIPEPQQAGRRKMKKGLKIALVSLASLLGLVVVAVALVAWIVLTPARLTSMVNRLADKFITCESHFESVDLTLVKSFPYVGLEVENVYVVNPIPGAPSDTVASVDKLVVGFNLREFLKNKNIEVTKLHLSNTRASLFTNRDGLANYDIFPHSEEEDTTSSDFTMPDMVALKSIVVKDLDASYLDLQSGLAAVVAKVDLRVDGNYDSTNAELKSKLDISAAKLLMDTSLNAELRDVELTLSGNGDRTDLVGDLNMRVGDGRIAMNGQEFVNDALSSANGDLLLVDGHVSGNLQNNDYLVHYLHANIKNHLIMLNGTVVLPDSTRPLSLDLKYETDNWGAKEVLDMLPDGLVELPNTMKFNVDAKVSGTVVGEMYDSVMPLITARVALKDGSFSDPTIIPYRLTDINADVAAELDLNTQGVSNVSITRLTANAGRNRLELSGRVADLLGSMIIDANVGGTVYLPDLQPLLPDTLNLAMDGKARLNLKAHTNLEQLQNAQFDKMKVDGRVALTDVNVDFDSIMAETRSMNIDIHLPANQHKKLFNELLSAQITTPRLKASLPGQKIDAEIEGITLKPLLSNLFDTTQPLRIACDFAFDSILARMDGMTASLAEPEGMFAMLPQAVGSEKVAYKIDYRSSALHADINDSVSVDLAGLTVKGSANYDPSKPNALQQFSPDFDVDFKRGYIDMEQLAYIVQIPDIKFHYRPERCEISSANVVFGNSDFYLKGAVTGLEKWLSHEDMLRGDLYFTSNFTNVDDLMEALSGMGTDTDTLEVQRKEDHVDTSAHPFIVPRDVDFTLHTRIKDAIAFENELQEVAGDVRICDGIAVLNQVGFVCKAARMQLTALYRTPRVNHIFVGLDFHLLDINIQELIDMIPYVDTLVPLLNDLEGAADFHLCAETYVNAFYQPKMSTLRGAAALTGQDLVVLDNKNIDKIAKLLQLKSWREDDSKIHLDSLDVAMTVFRKELEVYPFLLSLHKYQIVAEGRHNLDQNYDYHVELVQSPMAVRLAVDVSGTMPKLNFSLSPSLKYKNLYRPAKRNELDNEVLRLKAMIRQSLEANVRQSTRDYEGFDELDN